jgi:D-amino-acid dehydrogenase
MPADVVVIGGGVVGVAVAHALAGRGASVTLLERGERTGMACSAGNGGIVGAGHVEPLASVPALWEGMRALPRRGGPLAIPLRPSSIGWTARFAAAAVSGRDGQAAGALRTLALESAAMHRELAGRLDTSWAQRGFLSVFRGRGALRRAQRAAHGARVLAPDELRTEYPALAPPLAGGLLEPDEAHLDPARFVAALAEEALARGVALRASTEVLGLRTDGDRVHRLVTSRGDLDAGAVVVAAGAWSPSVLRGLPVALPVQGGKGYHVELPAAPGDAELPVYLTEERVVLTPMGDRVRIAGTLEVAGTDERVSMRRVDAVLAAATRAVPSLAGRTPTQVWRGLRPCTPDGLPAIGRAPRLSNVVLATGHGMWGLQLAPVTGRIVADVLEDRPLGEAERAMDPARLDRRATRRAGRAAPRR